MKFPWDQLPPWRGKGDVIEGKQSLPLTGWKRSYAFIISFFLLGLGIFSEYRITILLAFLLLLALLSKREAAMTADGFETFSNLLLLTNHRMWKWEQIDALTYEPTPKAKDQLLFYITAGDVTRHAVFPKIERKRILRLAEKRHPSIRIYDGSEFRKQAREKLPRKKK